MKKTIILFILAIMGSMNAQAADSAQNEAIRKGMEHFNIFCSNCHGINANGKGRLVESLKIIPSDLRALKQTGDTCIAERVLKAVSGVHDVVPGQEHKMPVFSGNLESITIYEITQFLKAIQK